MRPALRSGRAPGRTFDVGRSALNARWTAEEIRARGIKDPTRVQAVADRLADDPDLAVDEEPRLKTRRMATLSVPELKGPANARRQELLDGLAREQENEALLAAVQRRLGLKAHLPGEPGCVPASKAQTGADGSRPRRCPDLRIVIATMPDYVTPTARGPSTATWTASGAAGAMSYVLTGSTSRTGTPTPRRAR